MSTPDPAQLNAVAQYLHEHLALPEDTVFRQPAGIPVLPELDTGFTESVMRLCADAGMTKNEFYKKANISRQLFNALSKNANYRPTRTTVFACAIALQLTLDEARDLLMKAGYAFSRSNRTDVIVQYFIEQGIYDIDQINNVLYYYDQQPLGSL